MLREPLPGFRPCLALALLALPACRPATHAKEVLVTGAGAASSEGPMTALFANRTEKFYTGEVQLSDLTDLVVPALSMQRGTPRVEDDPGPWIRRRLALPTHEALEADLVTLPVTPEGVHEYQVEFRGPVTSGPFFADAESRNLTISLGFDAAGEPLFCVGLLQDTVARTPDAFWIYQNLPAAPVGGVFKLGRTAEDSYWRPITLRAELQAPVAPDAEEDWPGQVAAWEYRYGQKAPAAPGQLSDLANLREFLD